MNFNFFWLKKRKNKENFCIWMWPSITILFFIIFLFLVILNVFFQHINISLWREIFTDKFILRAIFFTTFQSILSTFLSITLSIIMVHSLYHQCFPGRKILLNIFDVILVQPIIVSVLGIIDIYGNQGWLSTIFRYLHLPYKFCLYSFKGILLIQVFLNIPLSILCFLQELERIPIEHKQLAIQINMSNFEFFRIIEWFYIRKKIFSTATLTFILCFTNFSSVYSLGGNIKYSPIGLIIYQSLYYDFNINCAFTLTILQILICMLLTLNFQKNFRIFSKKSLDDRKKYSFINNFSFGNKIIDWPIIFITSFFLLSPLLTVIINGLRNIKLFEIFKQKFLWESVFISLNFSVTTGLLCLIFTIVLVRGNCELQLHKKNNFFSKIINLIGTFILFIPNYVFAVGLFPLLINLDDTGIFLIVLIVKILSFLPYSIKIIENSMYETLKYYHRLSCSLNLMGFYRFWKIEFPFLKEEMGKILSFVSAASVGDLGIILLLGNDKLRTLSLYLYQQMYNYQNQESSVTAMILLFLCFFFLLFFDKILFIYDKTE